MPVWIQFGLYVARDLVHLILPLIALTERLSLTKQGEFVLIEGKCSDYPTEVLTAASFQAKGTLPLFTRNSRLYGNTTTLIAVELALAAPSLLYNRKSRMKYNN